MIRSRQRPRVGGGSGASGSLAMRLDLLSSTSLDQRVTFSRGTNATMIDSTGTLTYAPSNQIPSSESLTATTWLKVGLNATTPVISNATVAPDGTTTADSVVEDTANSTHRIDYSGLAGNAGKYAASVYLKAGTRTFARLQFDAVINAVTSSCGVQINLTDGTPSATTAVGNITSADVSVTSAGNGWYRVGLIFTISPVYVLSGGSVRIYLMQSLVANPTYVGNGSNIFVWGAQFGAMTYETAPRAYNSTTPKNLLGRTEEFDNAAWAKSNSYVQTNLLLYSEQFDVAATWVGPNVTITVNNTIAPNGTTTADKIVETISATTHQITQTTTFVSGTEYTWSIFVKAAERSAVRVLFPAAAFTSNLAANFDIATGAWRTVSPTPPPALTLFSQDAGNGWYRISATATATASVSSTILFLLLDNPSGTGLYTGNSTSGLYAWGAQMVQGATAGNYQQTLAAAAAVQYTAPNGYLNADKLVEDAATSEHFVDQPFTAISATTYTYSAYLKAGERSQAVLRFAVGSVFVGGSVQVGFTLTGSGSSFAISGSPTAQSITAVGNGWYRCSISVLTVPAVAATPTARVQLYDGTSTTYTGNGTSGAYLWGAQLSDSASVDPYVYNPAAALTSTAYYGPRFDYDPVTLAPLGLLIEEARTNLIVPSDANAGWSASPVGTVAVTANATTSPDGTINATKLATNDTATGGHSWFKTHTGAINTAYCGSAYFKAEEYTRAQISFGNTGFASVTTGALFDLTGAGAIVATGGGSTATITPVGNGWYRCSVTATSDADGGTYAFTLSPKPASVSTFNGNYIPAATGLGVYVYGVQVEAAAFATSYIPTVAASVTRSADIATMVGNNFTNWYNEASGTILTSADTVSPSGTATAILSFQDAAGSATNRHQLSVYSNCAATVLIGTTQASIGLNTLQTLKAAYGYQDNNFGFSANGGTVALDTGGTVPLSIGYATLGKWDYGAAPSLNGHIKSISYYNTRLTDAQLQAITL